MTFYNSVFACALLVVASISLAVVVVVVLDKFRLFRERSLVKSIDLAARTSLSEPAFYEIEQYLGSVLPVSFRRLYGNSDEIHRIDFFVKVDKERTFFVSHYHPCNLVTLIEFSDAYPAIKNYFSIATDGGDVEYIVDLNLDDPPVVSYDAEENTFDEVVDSLSKFLSCERVHLKNDTHSDNDSPPER